MTGRLGGLVAGLGGLVEGRSGGLMEDRELTDDLLVPAELEVGFDAQGEHGAVQLGGLVVRPSGGLVVQTTKQHQSTPKTTAPRQPKNKPSL